MKAACATLMLLAVAAGATAEERCDVPVDKWQPREVLKAKLERDGWKVDRIKAEDGCYEVYAVNAAGKTTATFFDPQTLQAVGDDGEG